MQNFVEENVMIVKAIDLPEDKMDKDKEIDDDGDEIGNAHFEFSLKKHGNV